MEGRTRNLDYRGWLLEKNGLAGCCTQCQCHLTGNLTVRHAQLQLWCVVSGRSDCHMSFREGEFTVAALTSLNDICVLFDVDEVIVMPPQVVLRASHV